MNLKKIDFTKKDLNKIKKLREETIYLNNGDDVEIHLGGPFYLSCRLEWQEDIFPSLCDYAFTSKTIFGKKFTEYLNDYIDYTIVDYNHFSYYPEVVKFKNRIDKVIEECEEMSKKYGQDENYIWSKFVYA